MTLELGGPGEAQHLVPRQVNENWGAAYLSTATYKWATIFPAIAALTITRVAAHFQDWSYGTAPTYRISIQGVDANGNPDGAIKAAGQAYADFTPTGTGNDGKLIWFALGTPYTCTPGELLALVIQYQSGTVNASNHTRVTIRSFATQFQENTIYNAAGDGAWTRQTYAGHPFAYGNATETHGAPHQALTSPAIQADSNPNEYALVFTIPTTLCAAYTIRGINFAGITPPAGKSFTVTLYDTDGTTILCTRSFDSDALTNQATSGPYRALFTDNPLPILYAGAQHRIAIKPDQTTTNLRWYLLGHADVSDLDAYPFARTWYLSTRYNAAAWQDTPTTRPIATLIIDHLWPTYPPPDAAAINDLQVVMLDATDGKTPKTGLAVTLAVSKDRAAYAAATNPVVEVGSGTYATDLAGADQGSHSTTLKFSAAGALTQYLHIRP